MEAAVVLIEANDDHFAWMLGEAVAPQGLRLPPGGVDDPQVLLMLRGISSQLQGNARAGSWLIAVDLEVVGLCGFKRPPRNGIAEIGYGIAASRRRRGYATRAVAALLNLVSDSSAVQMLIAETAVTNTASQKVLEINAFVKTGTRNDLEEGELICWSRSLPISNAPRAVPGRRSA
jgi:RimJ/RimL family protein N-acetyltransferase